MSSNSLEVGLFNDENEENEGDDVIDFEEEESLQSGESSHSLASAGNNGSGNGNGIGSHGNNGSNGNLPLAHPPKSRASAIMASQKKMRKSASAPNVAQNLDKDSSKKRNRTSPEQLMILEEAFLKNPTPNAQVREMLAEKVDMTSRSVQIWFQNRRAKEKKNQLKVEALMGLPMLNSGGIPGRPPLGAYAAQFQQLSPAFPMGIQMNQFGQPVAPFVISQPVQGIAFPQIAQAVPKTPSFNSNVGFNGSNESRRPNSIGQKPRSIFNLDRLKVGTWTRLTISPGDLICKVDPSFQTICWEIVEGPHRCKIEFSFNDISNLEIEVVSEQISLLVIQITSIPSFYLETRLPDGRAAWKACNDITEGQQASQHSKHLVEAQTALLKHYLLPIINEDPQLSKISQIKEQETFSITKDDDVSPKNDEVYPEDGGRYLKKAYSVPSLTQGKPFSQFGQFDSISEFLADDLSNATSDLSLDFTQDLASATQIGQDYDFISTVVGDN